MEATLKALKEFRKRKNMTQKQLGEYLNVAHSTIAMWERGEREPKCSDLKRLADVLDISVDELLSHNVIKKQSPRSEIEEKFISDFNELCNDNKRIILSVIRAFLTEQAASVFGSVINNNNGNGNFFANNGDVYAV